MNACELRNALLQLIESKAITAADNDKYVYATVNDSMLYVRVKDIRFIGDEILVFDGHDSEKSSYTVIQHISQLSMCISERPLPATLRHDAKVIQFENK